jgi:hypothetical protein
MGEALHLTSNQYSITLLVFFVSYVLFEVASNMCVYILDRLWSITLTATASQGSDEGSTIDLVSRRLVNYYLHYIAEQPASVCPQYVFYGAPSLPAWLQ